MSRTAALLLVLGLALPAWAQDPCRPTQRNGLRWRTVTGCLATPWDAQDPSRGEFSLYFEMTEPEAEPIGDLLVFHGGPAYPRRSLRDDGPLWVGLKSHFRVLYFHQRGSGYSARVASRDELKGRVDLFTLRHLLADAHHLHESLLGGSRVSVMGKSAGGFLALLFALEYPEVTDRLVLAATAAHHEYISQRTRIKTDYLDYLEARFPGYLDDLHLAREALQPGILAGIPTVRKLLQTIDLLENVAFDLSYTLGGQVETVAITRDAAAGRFELLLERVAAGRKTLRSTGLESLAVLNLITCREFAFARSNAHACVVPEAEQLYDVRPRLGELALPTLVLGGRFDPILPPRFQREIVAGMGDNAELHVLDFSAHMLFLEQPQATAQLVLDFLGVPHQQAAQTPAL